MELFDRLIGEINDYYRLLCHLSNDELRLELQCIKTAISLTGNGDQNIALNNYLPKAFAILKETCKRFTEGDVIVTANEKDIEWSNIHDFIDIDEGKAIYHNHWQVRGDDYKWNMIPYDVQLLGGICLHYGYAAEMATGEGKTLVVTFSAFLNALTNLGVHVITSNDYLSLRDYEQMRPLYMFFGFSVGCIEKYERGNEEHRLAYDNDITFGTSSTFIFDYLFDHMALKPEDCNQKRLYNYAIIDEIDSILIDEAETPHIIGGGQFYNEETIYKKYNNIIIELIKNKSMYNYDTKKHFAEFTEEGKIWLREKSNDDRLFTISKPYEISNFNTMKKADQESWNELFHSQNVLNQLLLAYTVYTKDIDYIIYNNSIVIIDKNTGRPKPSNRWEYGLHTAVEVKENVKVKDDFDGLGVISTKNFYIQYKKLSGMSGSILQVADELKADYNLATVSIPTNKPLKRVDHILRIFKSKELKYKAILELIQNVHSTSRPILVGCPSIIENEEICNLLKAKDLPFMQLNAKFLAKEAYVISQAGQTNAITVSTSIAGRGTDIKLSTIAKQSGGLYVIGSSLFDSLRIDRQLKGRAGRQGDPGDSQFFASVEDELIQKQTDQDIIKIKHALRKKGADSVDVIKMFERMQQQDAEKSLSQRRKISLKDDTVNPFRTKFYTERNKLLFDKKYAIDFIYKIIGNSETKLNEVNFHIQELYTQIYPIVTRILSNESEDDRIQFIYYNGCRCGQVKYEQSYVDVPFSDSKYLFVLSLNKKDFLASEEYFKVEYIRQNILLVYDNAWTKFVQYVMCDLDTHEIGLLPEKYKEMYFEIENSIISRLLNASIPIGAISKNKKEEHTSYPHDHFFQPISDNDPCPCGSGKNFSECHKRNTNKRRRRLK